MQDSDRFDGVGAHKRPYVGEEVVPYHGTEAPGGQEAGSDPVSAEFCRCANIEA